MATLAIKDAPGLDRYQFPGCFTLPEDAGAEDIGWQQERLQVGTGAGILKEIPRPVIITATCQTNSDALPNAFGNYKYLNF